MPGDMHTHTSFSDGSTDIEDLLDLAGREKLDYIAVTDHDTHLSIQYANENPLVNNVKLIAASEMTCYDPKSGRRVHLLCYCPKLTKDICDFFKLMSERRNVACNKSIVQLEQLYPQFCKAHALRFAKRSGVTYKAHLIRVLYELGYTDGIYKTLYNDLFVKDGGRVLHEPQYEKIDTILDLVKAACGVVVVAHPSVYDSVELVKELANTGKIDGVEIYHPRNNSQDIKELEKTAEKHKLIVTGGSDFHGMHMSRSAPVGSCLTQNSEIEKIICLAKARKMQ